MPYWDEPKYNDPDEIDEPSDVTLPSTMHHMQAKAELDLLVQAGVITDAGAQSAMKTWKAKSELANEDMVNAAIGVLEDNELIEESTAEELRQKAV